MIKRTKMGSIRFPEGGKGPFEGNASAEPPPDLAASQGIPIKWPPFKKAPRFPFQSKSGLEVLRGDSAEYTPPPLPDALLFSKTLLAGGDLAATGATWHNHPKMCRFADKSTAGRPLCSSSEHRYASPYPEC